MKKIKQPKDKIMIKEYNQEPREPQEPQELAKEQPKEKKTNRWISHVKSVATNQNITYCEALKIASATYTK
jgi:hypothetical protein